MFHARSAHYSKFPPVARRNAGPQPGLIPSISLLEEFMGTILKIVAIATVPAWLAIHANPAAAQNFNDRWSVIPKAHAEPAPEEPAQTKQDDQKAQPSSPNGQTYNSQDHSTNSQDHSTARHIQRTFSGRASFYSYRRAKTASGSSFDRDQLTAAHRSLPLGTKVRVTDLASNKSVVVRITDRGPNIRGRVLDLSLGAARSLGIIDRGVVEVRAEVLG
jgi:rare lipoprotein A